MPNWTVLVAGPCIGFLFRDTHPPPLWYTFLNLLVIKVLYFRCPHRLYFKSDRDPNPTIHLLQHCFNCVSLFYLDFWLRNAVLQLKILQFWYICVDRKIKIFCIAEINKVLITVQIMRLITDNKHMFKHFISASETKKKNTVIIFWCYEIIIIVLYERYYSAQVSISLSYQLE